MTRHNERREYIFQCGYHAGYYGGCSANMPIPTFPHDTGDHDLGTTFLAGVDIGSYDRSAGLTFDLARSME